MSTSGMSTTNIMDRSRASSTAGSDATRRAYLSHAHRRRPPPRFQPFMIIILVLSAGLLLIGLTMTIIGLWPSYSPSGGNPLQIVGPLMLGLGLLGLIGSIIYICYRREHEKQEVMKSISDMRSSRMTLASQSQSHHSLGPVTPTPSVHARPSKGILKASSTSSHNGTARGSEYESDSGMANTHSFSTNGNRSYERDSNASDNSRNLDNIRVEMMPDPTAHRHGKPVDQSSTGSDQGVPPSSMGGSRGYRQPSSNKQARPTASKPTYNNQGYSPDARETDIDGDLSGNQRRQMQNYGPGGYDAYDPSNISGGGLGGGITGGGALGSPGGVLGSPNGTPHQATPVSRQPKPQQQYQPPQPQQQYQPPQPQQQYQPPQPQQQYQSPEPQPQQQRARWGSKSPKSPTGQANLSYTEEVSTVSAAYQQATQPYPSTPTSSSQRHYTSFAHSGGAPTTPADPSSSTEV